MILFVLLFIVTQALLLHLYQSKPLSRAILSTALVLSVFIIFKHSELSLTWLALCGLAASFVMTKKNKLSLFWSGFISVSFVLVYFLVITYFLLEAKGESVFAFIESLYKLQVQKLPAEMQTVVKDYKLTPQDMLVFFATAIFMMSIFVLSLALVLVKNIKQTARHWKALRLSKLTTPSVFLWIFVSSLVVKVSYPGQIFGKIEEGLLMVCVLIFFLQGAAILGYAFKLLCVSLVWRVLWVVMIVLNPPMFLFIALIGLIDYWADFRSSLDKRNKKIKKRRQS